MAATTFFDILGIDHTLPPLERIAAAAAIWPDRKIHFLLGDHDDSAPLTPLVEYLQTALTFKAVRPGATPDGIGLYAEIDIINPVLQQPLVISTIPDVAFHLLDTAAGKPVRCYITKKGNGKEIVLEALPVEIKLPPQLLEPQETSSSPQPPNPILPPFEAGIHDSYEVKLNDSGPSSIFVHVKVRITDEWDFIIEPAVVISVGPCLFSGLPCFGVHDINLVPSPILRGDHEPFEQALEWTRHTIEPAESLFPGDSIIRGVLTVRTIDLDSSQTPLKEVTAFLNSDSAEPGRIQFVLEDVAIPFFDILLVPMPIHATLGIRRNIEFGDKLEEAFSFVGAPIKIQIAGFIVLIEEFMLESIAPDAEEDSQIARVQMAITRGELFQKTTLSAAIAADSATLSVATTKGFDEPPFVILLDADNPNRRERVRVGSVNGNQLGDLERAYKSTTAFSHEADTEVRFDQIGNNAVTFGFTEEWTGQIGWRREEGFHLFTLGDNMVKIWGAKLGFSFKRLRDTEDYKWYNYIQVLADLSIEIPPSDNKYFRIEVLNNQFEPNKEPATSVLRDIGWDLDGLSLESFSLPEGTQIILFDFFKLILHEIAMQVDKNGGTYLSFTGGLAIAGEKYGAKILVHRFRLRIAGNPNASLWMLDGITFELKIKSFELLGSGIAGEFIREGHTFNELQFGLALAFRAFKVDFKLALFLFKGRVTGPIQNFKYWMFGFNLGFIPVASIDLYNVRLLAANNLAPNLAPPDGSDQHLRVFNWYKNSTTPLRLPDNRQMNAWIPKEDSFAFGIGAAGSFGGNKTLLLDLFVFGHNSPDENGFMIALEAFVFESPDPIGIGVLEVDLERGKWAFFLAVSLSFSNILPEGVDVPGLNNVAALSGSLYLGNQPGTFALGQLTDQDTWLGFRMKEDRFFKLDLVLAICLQFVDRPEGPKGFGFVLSAKGGCSFGIGKAECYFTFLLIAGIWKNESSASGLILFFEAGFRIKLFRVFSFGAGIKVQIDFLGPNPEYKRLGFEIHIDTPWYLPDVSFRFEKIYNAPKPEAMSLVSKPIISAEALQSGAEQPTRLLITALQAQNEDDRAVYNLSTIRNLAEPTVAQSTLDQLEAVGVDSTIALNFKPPVDDKLSIGTNTPAGAGTQKAVAPAESEMAITYELISLSIRRQPRYGSNANQWTSLLAPEDTEITPLEDWPTGTELEALFSSKINVMWDEDVQAEGRLDPRRLLINSETPFTLITGNAQVDESVLIYRPGWPCCNTLSSSSGGRWHSIHFTEILIGTRVPGIQIFSDSNSTLRWLINPRPAVLPSVNVQGNPPAARIHLRAAQPITVAIVSLDQPVFHFRVEAYWKPQHRHAELIMEGYHGLELVEQQTFDLANTQLGFINMQDAKGFTTIVFRFTGTRASESRAAAGRITDWIEIVRMEYRTVKEEVDSRSGGEKCNANEDRMLSSQGQIAWLPNHNYEITATTRVVLDHKQSGMQEGQIVQKAYFHTKGMIGLNAVDRIGREVEPYVAAQYPAVDLPYVYREEPIFLAFTEQFNLLLPVDRDLSPDNPAELNQILEWDLTVDKMGDPLGHNRISRSNDDWIITNRGSGSTNPHFDFSVLLDNYYLFYEREAFTLDLLSRRLDGILNSPFSCGNGNPPRPHRSLVLMHQPVDPSTSVENGLWEANTAFRANLKPRPKDSPSAPFIHRNPFEADDVSSFTPYTEQAFAPNTWMFENGAILPTDTAQPSERYFALFGEEDWNHVSIRAQLHPNTVAGIGVGMEGFANGVQRGLLALIDENNRQLKVFRLENGNSQEEEALSLPEGLQAPYQLEITAFDDQLDIRLDDLQILQERRNIRAGRLALISQDGGAFTALTVETLDAYQFYFQSSRFSSFAEHIQSAENQTQVIPAGLAAEEEAAAIQQLYADTKTQIQQLMAATAGKAERLQLFRRWTETLTLPLHQNPNGLKISRLENDQGTLLLLLESPEPLRFSKEISLLIERETALPDGCLSMLLPTLKVMGRTLPKEVKSFEKTIPKLFPAIKEVEIDRRSLKAKIGTAFLRPHGLPPRYAIAKIKQRNRLRSLVFRLSYSALPKGLTSVEAQLLSGSGSFLRPNPFFNPNFGRLSQRMSENDLLLLGNSGNVMHKLTLPPVSRKYFVEQSYQALSNGTETAVLLIPLDGPNGNPMVLPEGKYRFHFNLDRNRYPQNLGDTNANYSSDAVITTSWYR